MSKMEDIQNFWKIIQENIKELTDEESEELEIYEKILEALDKIHPEIFYEFMLSDDDILTLVLSAGGNKELFPLIEEMVSKAPKLSELEVQALMPNLGFEETIFLQSSDMNVADVYFLPNRKTENQQISLDIYVPKINYSDSGDEKEELHFALVDSIVEGIGERFYAEKISSIHVFSMDKTPKDNKLIPLLELEEYLNSLK